MADNIHSPDNLKAEADRLREARQAYFNSLTPPLTEEQAEQLQEMDNLALEAMAQYFKATREQGQN